MLNNLITLSIWDLTLAGLLVVLVALISVLQGLGLHRQVLIAALRSVLQLGLIGLVLKVLFETVDLLLVALVSMIMLAAAGYEVISRQQRSLAGLWGYGIGAGSMFLSSFSVAMLSLVLLIQPQPWYLPQYAIPLLGMLLGNTMTGVALGMDRLTQALWRERTVIEARIALGQTWQSATLEIRREALRSALMPIVNSMAAAGLVSLPGMMTGQILGGSPPIEAAKYQLLILFLIAGGTGVGALTAVYGVSARLFDERGRLTLWRLKSRR